MDKLKMHSPDLSQDNIAKIRELLPGCVTEARDEATGKLRLAVDFDQLRQELTDHIVEGPQERYRLDWPGKRESLALANKHILKTLRPHQDESVDFQTTRNLFIEGDNLEALKLLQENYLGKVGLIYIDPPYNTGRDFVYRDDFSQASGDFLKSSGQKDIEGGSLVANPETSGRFHSDWLTMMASRLRLARNLLANDGFVFISIDDNELCNLVTLCNEIFGSENHVANFVWKSKSGGANDSGKVAVDHEYVVCFSRLNKGGELNLDPYAVATTSYNYEDDQGRYSLERLDKQNLQYSSSLDYEIVGPDNKVYKLEHRDPNRPNAIWRWSKNRVKKNMDQLVFKDGHVYTKNYEKKAEKHGHYLSMIDLVELAQGVQKFAKYLAGIIFDNPKPTKLVKCIAAIGSKKNSIVLDFFAGSSTTAHAVMQLNAEDGGDRRFFMVQLPEGLSEPSSVDAEGYSDISQMSQERIRRAGKKILEGQYHPDWNRDVGFRVLKVDTSNMKDVYYRPDELKQSDLVDMVDNVKAGRTAEDLLFQVLVDWGVDLTLPIRRETVQGKTVFFVDDNALVACFDRGVTEDLVKELAGHEPLRVVFRDNGFVSDAVKINVEQIFRQLSPTTDVKSI